ncbi:putative flavin-containing monooxygenase 1 [Haematococcus lacustris]|uniref:Putative flavin-containing monooxygenase 1 n=1 Tax=Haematococcus lacustris TaxID=44745 RepID=A0A699YIF8_HAELA|nr:putative flavin-containing monooxygenase 1 [Haematococcus lacustris]
MDEGVLLDTGQEVPADLVVYCTGFKQAVHIFDATVVQRLRVADDGLYLYRGILHPDVDDLAFIGCGPAQWPDAAATASTFFPTTTAGAP